MLTGPAHLERPFHAFHDEILRWYDHWLKGKDTGILDEPPVKVWVMGENRWRAAADWPLPRRLAALAARTGGFGPKGHGRLELVREVDAGEIRELDVRHGLPFSMEIELAGAKSRTPEGGHRG